MCVCMWHNTVFLEFLYFVSLASFAKKREKYCITAENLVFVYLIHWLKFCSVKSRKVASYSMGYSVRAQCKAVFPVGITLYNMVALICINPCLTNAQIIMS